MKILFSFLLALLFACNQPAYVPVATPTVRDSVHQCTIRTVPNLRMTVVTPQMLASTPAGMTPNVTFHDEWDFEALQFFNMDTAALLAYIKKVQSITERQFAIYGIRISHITKIWKTPDPYTGDIYMQLDQFGKRMDSLYASATPKEADLFFLNAKGSYGGGVAYFGTFCYGFPPRHRCAVAQMSCTNLFIDAVVFKAHEEGHPFGCNHTFDCAWVVDGIPGRKLDGSYSVPLCGTYSDPVPLSPPNNAISYKHIMSYYYDIDSSKGFGDQPGDVARNAIFSRSDCLIYPNGIPSGTNPPPPIDTCTAYAQTQSLSCPVGKVGAITQSRYHICPNGWSAWTTVSNTCHDTIVACSPATNVKATIIKSTVSNGIKLLANGLVTNRTYLWSNGTKTQYILLPFGTRGSFTVVIGSTSVKCLINNTATIIV